jgi:hypothetical protein
MAWHAAELRRLDGIIWAIVAGVAAFVLIAATFSDFTVVLRTYAAPASICLLLKLGARWLRALGSHSSAVRKRSAQCWMSLWESTRNSESRRSRRSASGIESACPMAAATLSGS